MYNILLILLVIFIIYYVARYIQFNIEKYIDYNDINSNYRNGVFVIRPPYKRAYDYIPYETISPVSVYKKNFLPFPMEGFQNKISRKNKKLEPFLGFGGKNETKDYIVDTTISEIPEFDNKIDGTNLNTDILSSGDTDYNIPNMNDNMNEKKKYLNEINSMIKQIKSNQEEDKLDGKTALSMKFFSTDKCGTGYNYTGASFSAVNGNMINCGGSDKTAEATAIIKNGSINKVIITNGGSGYKINPDIKIIGNGRGGDLKANVVEGEVKTIDIISPGTGYTNTPELQIGNPNLANKCFLCQKI